MKATPRGLLCQQLHPVETFSFRENWLKKEKEKGSDRSMGMESPFGVMRKFWN